jgi:hypothetical protein
MRADATIPPTKVMAGDDAEVRRPRSVVEVVPYVTAAAE